jgi:WD40 repeat protein
VNQQEIASASADHTIKIWNTQTGQVAQTLTDHSDQVLSVTSLVDQAIASSGSDKTIKIWR